MVIHGICVVHVHHLLSRRQLNICLNFVLLDNSGCGSELLFNMQFWQEVTYYELNKEKTADQRLHVSQAWDIFNKYVSSDAVCSIGKGHQGRSHGVDMSTPLLQEGVLEIDAGPLFRWSLWGSPDGIGKA